ncbi:hypothetical protein HHX47_DHR2000209 [Lentinula edodes]|nr:hypothetical protein HHX47_DHR2000209 [Lentinula edodes]
MMKQSLSCPVYLLGLLLFPLVTCTAAQVLITPPANPLDSASKPVANNFVSLSIAIHFFQDYSRIGTEGELPNTFSRNLLSSLQESTFLAPEIRIGGTSADRTTYVPSQNTTILQVSGANGIPLNVTLNQKWFQQCFDEENFPSGTKFIFDLPLMRNDSLALNNTIQGSKWALEAIGEKRLEAFEIGNEEDLQTAFNANVNENFTLKSVSLHNYPAGTAPWVNLGNTFMNHTAIVANLSQVKDDIAFLGSSPSTDNIVFNLGETNIDFTNLNMDQFEGVLGSALWTIDYILYAASLSINRIYLHQGTTFGYAAWQPIATTSSPAKVRTPWYGLKFAAEAIGSHQGPIQIAPLDIVVVTSNLSFTNTNTTAFGNSTQTQIVPAQLLTSEKISAYAVYESSSLARIALINFNEWNGTTPYPRPSTVFRIVLPPSNSDNTGNSNSSQPNSVSTRLLTAPNGASADSDLTFGGIMWNYTTQGLPQRVESVPGIVQVERSTGDGSITVKVGASEALLIDIRG